MVRAAHERTWTFAVGWILWGGCSLWLISNELGVLAFVGTVLGAIVTVGLRDKFSNETTASAYSVFNQNGQAIVGGFTASQFERQLRGGQNSKDNDPAHGQVAQAKSSLSSFSTTAVGDDERIRRRKAAADAAAKRMQVSLNE